MQTEPTQNMPQMLLELQKLEVIPKPKETNQSFTQTNKPEAMFE